MTPRVSVVVPVRDEEGSLRELHRRVARVLDDLVESWELVLVDDGSQDASWQTMVALQGEDERVRAVRLSRNFGHEFALSAGIELARGDAVITMDADLQHPPELIPILVERWREGYDVVYGVMETKIGESRFKQWTSASFHRMLRKLSDVEVPGGASNFRLVDRRAVEAFESMRERNRFVRGMFAWVGFRQTGVPFAAAPRFAGHTKYRVPTMLRLAATGIFSFSTAPLRMFLTLGFIVSALAVIEMIFAIVVSVGGFFAVPGWASTVVIVSFLGGFQLIVLGVIGQYVGFIYEEVKRRPIYVVQDLREADPEAEQ